MLVDTGSSLNVLPKKALDRLDCEGLELKPSNIIVRAFDGSKRMVHGEVDILICVSDSFIFVLSCYGNLRVCFYLDIHSCMQLLTVKKVAEIKF